MLGFSCVTRTFQKSSSTRANKRKHGHKHVIHGELEHFRLSLERSRKSKGVRRRKQEEATWRMVSWMEISPSPLLSTHTQGKGGIKTNMHFI